MSIEQEITTRLKEAMRSKNERELNVLRMIKSQAQIAKTAPGFSGPTDDAFWLDVISKYVKQLKKAAAEFEKGGETGKERLEEIAYEVEYLSPFLPKALGEDEIRALVKKAIADSGAAGAKMAGKIVGMVMKMHKEGVDAETVKRIATEELG